MGTGNSGDRRPVLWEREISSGGVVFKRDRSRIRVCLIGTKSRQGRVWGLPKGAIEKGEKPEHAAEREVREETGLRARLVCPLQWIKYQYVRPRGKIRVFKVVTFFLFRYRKGSVRDHDSEVDEARWFPMEEAVKRAAYPGERKVLEKARRILKRRLHSS